MTFRPTSLPGVFEIDLEMRVDERGFFARSWCQNEFREHGLAANLVQCSVSYNQRKGTLRGLHYQAVPFAETKVIRCTSGSIYDVVVDLRPESPTFKKAIGVSLTARNRKMLYVPEGCGHGFLTMEPDSEVFYQMSEFYHPESSRGVRWNDPAFQIAWPTNPEVISERDQNYPDFE